MRSERDAAPWGAWIRAALMVGIEPEAFWRLSLKEWRALFDRESALARTDLDALMRRFPDDA